MAVIEGSIFKRRLISMLPPERVAQGIRESGGGLSTFVQALQAVKLGGDMLYPLIERGVRSYEEGQVDDLGKAAEQRVRQARRRELSEPGHGDPATDRIDALGAAGDLPRWGGPVDPAFEPGVAVTEAKARAAGAAARAAAPTLDNVRERMLTAFHAGDRPAALAAFREWRTGGRMGGRARSTWERVAGGVGDREQVGLDQIMASFPTEEDMKIKRLEASRGTAEFGWKGAEAARKAAGEPLVIARERAQAVAAIKLGEVREIVKKLKQGKVENLPDQREKLRMEVERLIAEIAFTKAIMPSTKKQKAAEANRAEAAATVEAEKAKQAPLRGQAELARILASAAASRASASASRAQAHRTRMSPVPALEDKAAVKAVKAAEEAVKELSALDVKAAEEDVKAQLAATKLRRLEASYLQDSSPGAKEARQQRRLALVGARDAALARARLLRERAEKLRAKSRPSPEKVNYDPNADSDLIGR